MKVLLSLLFLFVGITSANAQESVNNRVYKIDIPPAYIFSNMLEEDGEKSWLFQADGSQLAVFERVADSNDLFSELSNGGYHADKAEFYDKGRVAVIDGAALFKQAFWQLYTIEECAGKHRMVFVWLEWFDKKDEALEKAQATLLRSFLNGGICSARTQGE